MPPLYKEGDSSLLNQRIAHNFIVECSESMVFKKDKNKTSEKRYNLNIFFVLSMLLNRCGPAQYASTIEFLGLPAGKTFNNNINVCLCNPFYKKIIENRDESMKNGIEMEIRKILEEEGGTETYEE